jgi:hypothetical protein
VLVGVVDIDVPRARCVRLTRDRAREGRVLDARSDEDDLPLADVRADPDGDGRVAVEPV